MRSNQLTLKETNPGYSLEGLVLKLQYLMQRANSLENTMILGKDEKGLVLSGEKDSPFFPPLIFMVPLFQDARHMLLQLVLCSSVTR